MSAPHLALTRNQNLVLEVLLREKVPLSAYMILDHLRDHGLKAPLQIYRALDKLTQMGHVHRLESVNAFVACSHAQNEDHGNHLVAFVICKQCGTVVEFSDDIIADQVKKHMQLLHFQVASTTVEIGGLCCDCARIKE